MGFKIHLEIDGLNFGGKMMEKQLHKINCIAIKCSFRIKLFTTYFYWNGERNSLTKYLEC